MSEKPIVPNAMNIAENVARVVFDTAYKGEWEYGKHSKERKEGNRIRGYSPVIISPDLFAQASRVLEKNRWKWEHRYHQNHEHDQPTLLHLLVSSRFP